MARWKILLITALFFACQQQSKRVPIALPSSPVFQRGITLFYAGIKTDSAFYYFTSVADTAKDSLLSAMGYSYMAMIQNDAGDYFGGQESALSGLRRLHEANQAHHNTFASLYNELGVSSAGLKNYKAAIEFYDLAIEFQTDAAYQLIFLNNKAVSLRESGSYAQAIHILDSLVQQERGNNLAYARALTNLASVKLLADRNYNPLPDYRIALGLREREKNYIGIASSYNHISDYYLERQPDSALFYASRMYVLARSVNSSDQKLDALRKLVSLSPPAASRDYFQQYVRLNDSVTVSRNQAKNQFAVIRYQSEKNKADKLSLQKDNTQKELQILRQRTWIAAISIFLVAGIVLALWWIRRKRRQIKWETENAIRESELRTSQKVHDVVANGLYRILNELEYNEELKKEELLDKIDLLYEQSRDISYAPQRPINHISERINELITSFATPQTSVSLVGNDPANFEHVSPESLEEIEQILLELMINMSKHSNASHVVVRFDRERGTLVISYRDNGVGLPAAFKYGNGLTSTGNRIDKMGGKLILAAGSGPGAAIKIVLPIITP